MAASEERDDVRAKSVHCEVERYGDPLAAGAFMQLAPTEEEGGYVVVHVQEIRPSPAKLQYHRVKQLQILKQVCAQTPDAVLIRPSLITRRSKAVAPLTVHVAHRRNWPSLQLVRPWVAYNPVPGLSRRGKPI